MKNIYLIRHCQAKGQEPNAKLTAAGEEQARKLAGFLFNREIDYILSSPYERAVSTIKPFAEQRGLEVHSDSRLAERVLTLKPHPDWLSMLEKSFADPDIAYEGGESGNVAAERGISAINDILRLPIKEAAVITHGNLLSLILQHYNNRYGFSEWQALSNPDVFLLSYEGEKPDIKRIWNWE